MNKPVLAAAFIVLATPLWLAANVDWRWSDGLDAKELRVSGDVEFTDDESDVKRVSPGGWFSYEESRGFSTSRRYQATADASGKLTRKYSVDGSEKPLDNEARAWLRSVLPELLRESAIDAPARVRRILRQGGAPAVLAEIAKIRSNGSKRTYIQELAPIGNLNVDQFKTVLRMVRGIESDGDKASVLIFLDRYTLKDALRDHTFEAVSTIRSSGDKRRVLVSFVEQDSSRATLALVARAAEEIQSDGDKAAVLIDITPHYRGSPEMRRPFFRAAESIRSAGDLSRVLMAVTAAAGEDRDTLVDALRSTASVQSDGDKARVLVHSVGYWKEDDALRRAFFEAAGMVRSDGDRSRVLMSLIGRNGVSEKTLVEAVRSTAGLHSDGDKARVLIAVIEHSSGKPAVREEVRSAVGTIHSDGDYRRVVSALR